MREKVKTLEEALDYLKQEKKLYLNEDKYLQYDEENKMINIYQDSELIVLNSAISEGTDLYIIVPDKKEFEIEVGKFYKTRSGRKAFCFLVSEMNCSFVIENCAAGFITNKDGKNYPEDEENTLDIVGYWEEDK